MARKSSKLPSFRSDSEEAAWYATPEGRHHTQRAFERALREDKVVHSSGVKVTRTDPKVLTELMERAKATATRPVSLRIPVADLERAREIAKKHGIGYQTVMKKALREGLKRVG